jgi:hypothetical protein
MASMVVKRSSTMTPLITVENFFAVAISILPVFRIKLLSDSAKVNGEFACNKMADLPS